MKKLVLIFGILLAFCMSAMAQNLHTNGKMCNGSTTIACGETIYFYDDGGSSKHGRGVNLNHTIKSPEGTRIRITFTSFDVRGTGSYLRLYNGSTTTASYTAITNETTFISTGNVVLANFYTPSGWYTAGSGWVATIEVVDCPSTLGTVALACGDDAITIGGDAINTSATAYGVDQNAVRTYTAPLGTKLFLNITDLPDDADNDYIIVYDGTSMASARLGRYDATSSLPISITSTTNALTISFRSNSSVNGSWSATLQPDLCLDELADVELGCDDDRPVGGTYTANMFTRQVFRATNTDAQLMLDLSAIPNDSNNDYIEVYDGDGATATLIGRYFGYGRPSTIASSGNVMTIVFRSNATNNGTWAGVVSVDCPDVIRMPGPGQGHRTYTTCNAMVYDDGGPTGNYSNNLNDEYIVLRPGRSGCVLHLEGEFVFDWQNDWITIYDGVGLTGDVLWGGGHHGHGHSRAVNGTSGCYASTPGASANGNVLSSAVANSYPCATYHPKVTSKSGALTIRFHTNGSQTCDGFSFHVTCVPKPTDCYSTGVIVFKQDFGGNEASDPIWQTTAPADIAAACTYNWVGNGCPGIGDYSIRKFIYDGYQYYNYLDDHTHPGNIERGYLFQGDHDGHTDSYFYKQKINIECEGVDKLMVSLWAANINNEHSNPANMPNLEIGFFSDAACTQSLTGEPILTGTIPNMTQYGNCSNDANEWQFYYAELNSPPAGDVWFRIINTVGTTTGNDFVLDDIEVRACLPPSVLTRIDGGGQIFSSANVCAGDTLTLRADLDYSLGAQSTYTTPYYLWQRGVNLDPSDYDSPIVWTDMAFEGGDYVVGGVAIASTNTNDIGYDASNNPINDASNADNYENYSQVTIYEPPSTTDPTYTRHYYRIIIAGSIDALTSRYCHSASEPHVINVIRIPEIRFGGTNAICEGGEIDLSVTPESPRPGIWSIAKETDGIVENTTPPFNATINTDAGGNYHVTGALHDMITVRYQLDEVNGGCWNEKEIPVYPLPEITITPDVTTICEGSDITLLAASNQTSTFQWDGGPAGAEWLVDPITTTTYTVSVTTPHEIPAQSGSGTEILNCLSSAEKVVNVLPMPGDITVDGAPATPVCPGTVLTFTPSATGAGTLTYSWDGTNYYTAAQPGSTYTVTATTPGTATYTLYVKDTRTEGGVEYNCPATHDVVVTVYDNPTLAVSTLVDINCFGQSSGSFTLTGSSTGTSIAYGSGSTAYYDFSIDDGANFTHATAGNRLQYTFSDLHSGTYHVAIRDGHGCIHKEDVTISETQTAALSAEITDANTTPTCLGQSVGALTVTAENGTQGTAPAPAYTYAWSSLQTTASITDLPADTYTVTVTDAHGCSTTASKEVISRPVPSINASTTADDVCLSSSTSTLTVLNNNTLPIASHSWSVTPTTGAGLPANLGTASLTVTPTASGTPSDPVTYTYTDVVTATNGCVVSGEVVLTVNPTVILDHTSGDLDQTLCFDETLTDIVFERGGGATGFNFAWEGTAPASTCLNYAITGTTLTISEGASPVAGTYRYTVQTTGAISPCDNPSYSGTITIHPELTVSVTADHQSCVTGNIGVATATPAGGRPFGTAPDTYYTYAWNNS
ncbi:MAG: hypothetical protein IKJ56_11230, partial [Bacteroidales bacterium]|nr:hypothetical protein [Bacteroidales bacterium]